MPGGDRTGPLGMGPMTGRGAGYCGGSGAPGWASGMWAGGFRGHGRGGRHGWRSMSYFGAMQMPGQARMGPGMAGTGTVAGAPCGMTREQELAELKQQADQAASLLETLQQRISALEGQEPQQT